MLRIILCALAVSAAASWATVIIILLRLRTFIESSEAQLQELCAERDNSARQLHDALLQGFQGVVLRIQGVARLVPEGEPARCALEAALDRADEVLVKSRDRVNDQPSVESAALDLVQAFEKCIAGLRLETEIAPSVVVQETPRRIHPLLHDDIVSIGRESLINACRHSKASAISMKLTYGNRRFRLACQDNGIGIPEEIAIAGKLDGYLGLLSMRRRARRIGAIFGIRKIRPHGTVVEIELPARIAYIRGNRRSLLVVLRSIVCSRLVHGGPISQFAERRK